MPKYIVRETFTVKYFVQAGSRAEAMEKAEKIGPRDFDEIDQEAAFPPMTAQLDRDEIAPDAVLLIASATDPDLFWSNADGWGERASATRYTADECERLNLPMGGKWVSSEGEPDDTDDHEAPPPACQIERHGDGWRYHFDGDDDDDPSIYPTQAEAIAAAWRVG